MISTKTAMAVCASVGILLSGVQVAAQDTGQAPDAPSSEQAPAVPPEPSAASAVEPDPLPAESAEPDPEEAHYLLGLERLRTGDYVGAIEELREVLRIAPSDVPARLALGTALYLIADLDAAADAYRTVLRVEPGSLEAHLHLGTVLMAKHDWAGAREVLQAALRAQPESIQAHYNLGVVRDNLGDRSGAMEAYRQALALKPDFADAHYHVGLLLKVSGQEAEAAQEFYAAALAGLPRAQYFLGSAHASGRGVERNLPIAIQWWFRAAEQDEPQAKEALSQIRQTAWTKGKRPEESRQAAEAFAEFRRELAKEYPAANGERPDPIGAALLEAGQVQEGVAVLLREAYALSEPAHARLEALYTEGLPGHLPAHDPRIFDYLKRTAEEGSPRSRLALARILVRGLGVPQDPVKAKSLLKGAGSEEAKALLKEIGPLQQNRSGGKPPSSSARTRP
ncbi:tetratricopeptide repeat protein [Candidatus Nitrospira bockiana]